MTSPVRILAATALAGAALAAPAAANASTIGSSLDPNRGPADTVECASGCTFAMDNIGTQVYADETGTITSFRAKLAPGATATLRTFSRGGYGAMTPVATGQTVTGTGNLETYQANLPINRNETIGMDLTGTLDATRGTGTIRVMGFQAPNGTESQTDEYELEPTLDATITTAAPAGGTSGTSGAGTTTSSGGSTGGGSTTGGGSASGGGSTTGGGSNRSAENLRGNRVFTIQSTGTLSAGRHPVATVPMFNPADDSVSGTATLKVAGKVVAKARVFSISTDDVDFKLSRKVARKLAKGAKAVVGAKVAGDDSGKAADSTPVSFTRATTTAFDGTYRGSGPLVIVVKGGVVTSVSKTLFISSTRGSGSMTRAFLLPAPAVVGRDGTVKTKGSANAETLRFEATFKRNGTAKGYLSLWYSQIGIGSSGTVQSDDYVGASNWTAKRK